MSFAPPAARRPLAARSFRGPRTLLSAAAALAAVMAVAAAASARAESAELAAVRARIAANGWCWEADDAWIRGRTPQERAALRGFAPPPGYEAMLQEKLETLAVPKDLPSYFDWRGVEAVTSVKDQGQCGACWAFGTLAVIESFVKIYYGQELDLSEQQIIDCNPYGAGCNGGWSEAVYEVVRNYGAIQEDCARYMTGDGTCHQAEHIPFAWVTGWRHIANNVDQIKTALLTGPVTSTVDASGDFELYSSGCYDGGTPYTNHLVAIVGWDDRLCDGQGGWICKNSWGLDFGMGGYFTIKYGAAGIGSGCTQPYYTAPAARIEVTAPLTTEVLAAGEIVPIRWNLTAGSAPTVDIWFSRTDWCFETLLADDVPNTGEWLWTVPNAGTAAGRLLVHPGSGTRAGYGFTDYPLTIAGYRTRYVSAGGANVAPYESPATAARTIADAVAACTGQDTVLVAGGDYLEAVTVNWTVRLLGGWNADFTARDPAVWPSRLRGSGGALRFREGAGSFAQVDGFTFHDCEGAWFDLPATGRHGAAILSVGASPLIRGCRFEHNRAAPGTEYGLGGAIMAIGGAPRIEACSFTGNIASSGGAVALVDAAGALLAGNIFTGNAGSDSTAGHAGGAVWIDGGSVTIQGDIFTGNGGVWEGGALASLDAAVTLAGVDAVAGRAVQAGGALCVRGGTLVARGGALRGNSCGTGGGAGALIAGATADLRNLRVTGNRSLGIGGGLALSAVAGGRLENCVVSDNAAPLLGGGLFLNPTGGFLVRNCVVSGNAGGGVYAGGGSATLDYNDVWGNAGGDWGGPYSPGPHDLAGDPHFADAASGDYALGLHSCCLDRGDPDPACADPDGSRADIGAHGGPAAVVVAPAAVAGASLTALAGGGWRLDWTPGAAPDLARYVVYRDTAAVFTPGEAKACASIDHPGHSWNDEGPVPPGAYYLVVAVDSDGHVGGYSDLLVTAPTAVPGAPPAAPRIAAVAPNPFNPRATVWFELARAGEARLAVYDLRGRLVRELARGDFAAGLHRAQWDGRDASGERAAAGVYVFRLASGGQTRAVKASLAK